MAPAAVEDEGTTFLWNVGEREPSDTIPSQKMWIFYIDNFCI